MYSISRITPPPRKAVTIVYVVTGMTLNFANNSQQSSPYVPMVSSTMGVLLYVWVGSVTVRVEQPGHRQLLFQPAQTDPQLHRRPVGGGAGAGPRERGHLALGGIVLVLAVHDRPDVNER